MEKAAANQSDTDTGSQRSSGCFRSCSNFEPSLQRLTANDVKKIYSLLASPHLLQLREYTDELDAMLECTVIASHSATIILIDNTMHVKLRWRQVRVGVSVQLRIELPHQLPGTLLTRT